MYFAHSVGIILGFLSNDKISSTLDTYTSSVDAAIQDGVNYVDNTLDVRIYMYITSKNYIVLHFLSLTY